MQPLHPQDLEDSVRAYLGDLLKECTLENKLKKISRIVVNQKRFYSELYTRMEKRVCTVVLYGNGEVGKIKYFIYCNYTDSVYAVLQKLDKADPLEVQGQRVENHYLPVTYSHDVVVTTVESLKDVLVYLDVYGAVDRKYVIKMPNGHGHAIFK
jgi:hypothetical protein